MLVDPFQDLVIFEGFARALCAEWQRVTLSPSGPNNLIPARLHSPPNPALCASLADMQNGPEDFDVPDAEWEQIANALSASGVDAEIGPVDNKGLDEVEEMQLA